MVSVSPDAVEVASQSPSPLKGEGWGEGEMVKLEQCRGYPRRFSPRARVNWASLDQPKSRIR